MMPERIQLSRAKGWRIPANTVKVDRSTKWGNPCFAKPPLDQEYARHAYFNWVTGCLISRDLYGPPPSISDIQTALRGKNLGCWCKPGTPCHADVLLALANGEGGAG
jgi:hypothetical protein